MSSYTFLVIFFNFRNFFRCCTDDPQAIIAHAVKQSIKLPPLRGLLGSIIREEKLINGNMIPGEYLQARLLSLVLNICKVALGNIQLVANLFPALTVFISRGFYGCPESLKIVQWYRSFCHYSFTLIHFTVHLSSRICLYSSYD